MKNKALVFPLAALLASVVLMAGCSGIRAYRNTMKKNVFIDTEIDSGVRVSLDVYRVDSKCEANYEGTVFLGKRRSEVGIPSGELSYLSFKFARSSFFFGKSSTSHGTLLMPRSGKVYKAKALYTDDMYNVEIREAGSIKSKGAEVLYKELGECEPVK
jgi:hypothetical protein